MIKIFYTTILILPVLTLNVDIITKEGQALDIEVNRTACEFKDLLKRFGVTIQNHYIDIIDEETNRHKTRLRNQLDIFVENQKACNLRILEKESLKTRKIEKNLKNMIQSLKNEITIVNKELHDEKTKRHILDENVTLLKDECQFKSEFIENLKTQYKDASSKYCILKIKALKLERENALLQNQVEECQKVTEKLSKEINNLINKKYEDIDFKRYTDNLLNTTEDKEFIKEVVDKLCSRDDLEDSMTVEDSETEILDEDIEKNYIVEEQQVEKDILRTKEQCYENRQRELITNEETVLEFNKLAKEDVSTEFIINEQNLNGDVKITSSLYDIHEDSKEEDNTFEEKAHVKMIETSELPEEYSLINDELKKYDDIIIESESEKIILEQGVENISTHEEKKTPVPEIMIDDAFSKELTSEDVLFEIEEEIKNENVEDKKVEDFLEKEVTKKEEVQEMTETLPEVVVKREDSSDVEVTSSNPIDKIDLENEFYELLRNNEGLNTTQLFDKFDEMLAMKLDNMTIAENSTEEIKTEDLKVEEIKTEDLKVEEIKTEDLKVEEIKTEDLKVEEIKTEDLKVEEIKTEDLKVEESKTEDLKVEEIKTEDLKVEESKTEDSKVEEIKTEDAKVEELKDEEIKTEDLKDEEIKTEDSKVEEIKTEDLKVEEIKTDDLKVEELKDEVKKSRDLKDKVTKSEEITGNPGIDYDIDSEDIERMFYTTITEEVPSTLKEIGY